MRPSPRGGHGHSHGRPFTILRNSQTKTFETMANRTDPLISQVSGSDPQNLMEYLTRQRIYDSRYWKETCFGLTVQNVLQESTHKSTSHQEHAQGPVAIGHINFLALTLKLLQLHPEPELIVQSFLHQEEFKYTRALGALYVRLTGRPADIYLTLQALYADRRKIRRVEDRHSSSNSNQTIGFMDEYIHELLTATTVAGIALPRLPQRHALQEAGYLPLPEGLEEHDNTMEKEEDEDFFVSSAQHYRRVRPTALQDKLDHHKGPLAYLKYKALVEQCPAAMQVWKDQYSKYDRPEPTTTKTLEEGEEEEQDWTNQTKKKKPKKPKLNRLFKEQPSTTTPTTTSSSTSRIEDDRESKEYWNKERAKLGLAPLRE